MTCDYNTPYSIPETSPTEFYLYDGINFTMNIYFEYINGSLIPLNVQITRVRPHSTTFLFRGIFCLGRVACLNFWRNRCTHTFDQDDTCNPCEYSVTTSSYNSSIDDTQYVSGFATTIGTEFCIIDLSGNNPTSMPTSGGRWPP